MCSSQATLLSGMVDLYDRPAAIYYFHCKCNVAGGHIDFASFLDIMHKHSDTEKCQEEILAAFRAHDRSGKGVVPGPELTHILTKCGEKLTQAEGLLSVMVTELTFQMEM